MPFVYKRAAMDRPELVSVKERPKKPEKPIELTHLRANPARDGATRSRARGKPAGIGSSPFDV